MKNNNLPELKLQQQQQRKAAKTTTSRCSAIKDYLSRKMGAVAILACREPANCLLIVNSIHCK